MRVLICTLLISVFTFSSSKSFSQSYTTHSKSCGACGKSVSNNSTVGMRCPHCGARWGRENTHRTTTYDYSYPNNSFPSYSSDSWKSDYNFSETIGRTTSKANLRELPTKSSNIKTIIPSSTIVSILSQSGNWYYVKYTFWNGYDTQDVYGYMSKSLIN